MFFIKTELQKSFKCTNKLHLSTFVMHASKGNLYVPNTVWFDSWCNFWFTMKQFYHPALKIKYLFPDKVKFLYNKYHQQSLLFLVVNFGTSDLAPSLAIKGFVK